MSRPGQYVVGSSSSSSSRPGGDRSAPHPSYSAFVDDYSEGAVTGFIREEFFTPEKRSGNFQIFYVTLAFGAAIAFLRNFGEFLAV
ncbi:hypothetical protein G9A89_020992 [Geosiphon pyriformis]|nr:hypothetical protein G9A89_020992 [Geosiphon pyriformis]